MEYDKKLHSVPVFCELMNNINFNMHKTWLLVLFFILILALSPLIVFLGILLVLIITYLEVLGGT